MNKLRSFIFAILVGTFLSVQAQNELLLNTAKSSFMVVSQAKGSLKVSMSIGPVKTMNVSTSSGIFTELLPNGFSKIYDLGRPQLPTMNKLIEIPYGAKTEVRIISYDEDLIDLAGSGIPYRLMPCQPSMAKNEGDKFLPFYYDAAFYQQDAFNSGSLASVKLQGIMRGVQMGQLIISPFSYNPVQNILKVYNNLVIEIVFHNADYALTDQMKAKNYSPAFEPAYHNMINYQPPAGKDVLSKYPVKYVIVGPTSLQAAMQPFVQWKTKKGFTVVQQYYSSAPTATTVFNYINGLYTAGTPSDPAPTFLLIVGDVAQIPTNNSKVDVHKTDLYYCTFDGTNDYIPDMYYGRFSATSIAQLQPQIDKTLEYEKYLMPDPAYLDSVVMIAGVDNGSLPDGGYSQVHANGQINYGTTYYFNSAHGLYSNTYLWPVTNNSSTDVLIRNKIGTGVSYANYTAHGSSSGWADPSFQTSDVASMHNNHKYCLMVGNCCQTNTFNDTECFGEALLRAANKGALGYIGASNYSYWDEDYYWGVGNRANIVEFPTYDANNLGSYDRMFHDQGIPKAQWYATNGGMVYAGNLAVEASSSSMKQYYWEIYHLMGDPSVMTYFGVPDPLLVSYTDPQMVGVTSLVVNTEEDAYVAISHNGVLLDAELAPVGGIVTLNFPAFLLPDTADIVVTKQNKQPYIGIVHFMAPSIPLDAAITGIVTPDPSYNCAGVSISPVVTLTNMGTSTLTGVTINYYIDAPPASVFSWTGNLTSMQSVNITLPSVTLTAGTHTFYAGSSDPNGNTDQNQANDNKNKAFTVNQLTISAAFTAGITSFCSAPGQVTFTNQSSNAQTYLWDFGDGTTSTQQDPVHSYTSLGTYTVTLTASAGVCGDDVEMKTSYIKVGADIPVTTDASNCGPGSVTLTATGSGNISWYDALTGGNLLGTGSSYTTPVLSSTTNYYAQQTVVPPLEHVGKLNKETDATLHTNNNYYLIFTCYTPVVLKTVKVYTGSAGNKIIQLRNSAGTVLQSATVNLPNGQSTVTLNFNIPVGTDMQLACGTSNPNMYRDQSGITFPYDLAGKISITGTNATPNVRYYYYYDWVIESPSCTSARETATAFILTAAPVAAFSTSNAGLTVNFTNNSSNGISYFWDFGDGNTSVAANPSHTYAASTSYSVMLVVTNDCGSDTIYKNVDLTMVSLDENSHAPVRIYPNPANGSVMVDPGISVQDKIEILDVLGRSLKTYYNINRALEVGLQTYGAGIYYFRMTAGNRTYTCKVTNLK